MTSTAEFSPDGLYRYDLTRRWGTGPAVVWIMLNPSTADASQDDPTIRRCIGFTRAWGHAALVVLNLYAYRATDPRQLWTVDDPVGEHNDDFLIHGLLTAYALDAPVIAAWGANARRDRVIHVAGLDGADRLQALGTTKTGAPRHPLYLPGTATPTPWSAA